MSKAADICNAAAKLVAGDRQVDYGDKTENHTNIATLWSAYLGTPVTAENVAIMMILLKVARTKLGSYKEDTYFDMAGYSGIAGEIRAGAEPKQKTFEELCRLVPTYGPRPPSDNAVPTNDFLDSLMRTYKDGMANSHQIDYLEKHRPGCTRNYPGLTR